MAEAFAYKCRKCGASKELVRFAYFIRCDYCGSTICLDTDGYMHSEQQRQILAGALDASINPTPEMLRAMEEQGRLHQLMQQAIAEKNLKEYRLCAEAYHRLSAMLSPEGMATFAQGFERMSEKDRFDAAIRHLVDFGEWTNFHPEVTAAYRRMNAITQVVPSKPGRKSLKHALKGIEATRDYYLALYKIYQPEKYGFDSEPIEKMMRSAMAATVNQYLQDWVAWLSPEQKHELAVAFADLDPTIKAKAESTEAFKDSGKAYQFEDDVTCPFCGAGATKAWGCPIIVCPSCGYYQDDRSELEVADGKVTVSCAGCGSSFDFTDREGVYRCPYCASSYRYTKGAAAINRRYMEQFGGAMGAKPVRGLWEDPRVLAIIRLFFDPLRQAIERENISAAEFVYWLNENYRDRKVDHHLEMALLIADRIERWGKNRHDVFRSLAALREMVAPTGWFGHKDQWSIFIRWDAYPATEIYGRIHRLMPFPENRFARLTKLLVVLERHLWKGDQDTTAASESADDEAEGRDDSPCEKPFAEAAEEAEASEKMDAVERPAAGGGREESATVKALRADLYRPGWFFGRRKRRRTAEKLLALGTAEALAVLQEAAGDGVDERVRMIAAMALAKVRSGNDAPDESAAEPVEWSKPAAPERAVLPSLMAMSPSDWDRLISSLASDARRRELWTLALEAPPRYGRIIIPILREAGFVPEDQGDDFIKLCRSVQAMPQKDSVMAWELPHAWAILKGQEEEITTMAIGPDRRLLATGSDDHDIRIFDIAAGRRIRRLRGHEETLYSVRISPDGRILASAGDDGTVRLWDFPSGEPLTQLTGHEDDAQCLAFTPDGRWLVTGADDETIRLWSLPAGTPGAILRGHDGSVRALAVHPLRGILASAADDATVRLWSLPDGKPWRTFDGLAADVEVLLFSPDGNLLAAGDGARTVYLWETESGKTIAALDQGDSVKSLCFLRDGQILAGGGDNDVVKLWRTRDGAPVNTLAEDREDGDDVNCLARTEDGAILASSHYDRIVFWRMPARAPEADRAALPAFHPTILATLEAESAAIEHLCFALDDRAIVAAYYDELRIWSPLSEIPVRKIRNEELKGWLARLRQSQLDEDDEEKEARLQAQIGWVSFVRTLCNCRLRLNKAALPQIIEAAGIKIELKK